jgi:hypothetical protein
MRWRCIVANPCGVNRMSLVETVTNLPETVFVESGTVEFERHGRTMTSNRYTQHKTSDCPGILEGMTVTEVLSDGCEGDLFCSVGCLDEYFMPTYSLPKVAGDPDFDPPKNAGEARKAAPVDSEPEKTYTTEEVQALCAKLNRKFTDADMDAGLVTFATEWAKTYTGTFSYMVDMKEAAGKRKLSTPMARGVLNCFRNDVKPPMVEKGSGSAELDLTDIPSGKYAVPNGDTRLKVQIDNVTSGEWKGWVFVKDAAEYGSQKRFGKQAPNSIYVGEIQEQLAKIKADPIAAMAAYGHLTSTCGRCGRKLEDEESVRIGIGPICLGKMGEA